MKRLKEKTLNVNYSISVYSLIIKSILFLLFSSLIFFNFKSYKKLKELEHNNMVLNDELKITKNKNGELVATVNSYQTKRTEDFIKFATKDSLTRELQKEVKSMKRYLKKQGSVTKFSTETDVDIAVPTIVDATQIDAPVYKSSFDLDGWVFGSISASKDSTDLKLKVKNDYSLIVGIDPTGFLGLGKGKPFGQITNKNPYSTVKTMKTYNVSLPKDKKWGVGVYGGVNPFTGKPMILVGGGYNLAKF